MEEPVALVLEADNEPTWSSHNIF